MLILLITTVSIIFCKRIKKETEVIYANLKAFLKEYGNVKEMPLYHSIGLNTLQRLKELTKRIDKEDLGSLFEELYAIMKGYISNTLRIDYEFIYSELKGEMDKQKISPGLKRLILEIYQDIEESRYRSAFLQREIFIGKIKFCSELCKNS